MSMMFSKWKTKQSESSVPGVTEKDGDGDHRGYRTHLIFAGKRDPEASGGPSGGSQSVSHFYGGHSSSHSLSHSNHPFAQAQQIRQPAHHESVVSRNRKGSRPPNLHADEDFYNRAAGKQVKIFLLHYPLQFEHVFFH